MCVAFWTEHTRIESQNRLKRYVLSREDTQDGAAQAHTRSRGRWLHTPRSPCLLDALGDECNGLMHMTVAVCDGISWWAVAVAEQRLRRWLCMTHDHMVNEAKLQTHEHCVQNTHIYLRCSQIGISIFIYIYTLVYKCTVPSCQACRSALATMAERVTAWSVNAQHVIHSVLQYWQQSYLIRNTQYLLSGSLQYWQNSGNVLGNIC